MGIYFDAIKQARLAAKRRKEQDRLLASPLNYGILRDLLSSAVRGALVEIMLKDGTKLVMRQETEQDRLKAADKNMRDVRLRGGGE